MHKIWHWFRGDNDPKFWQGAAPSGDKRRWRSERAVGGRTSAGARRQGATIAQNFDAVQAASVSSPTVLTPQQTKSVKTVQDRLVLIKGHDKRPSKSSMGSAAATAAAEDEEAQATTSAAATAKSARKQQQKAKPPIPSTSSANQKVSSRHKSRGTATKAATPAAVTTDDLPDKVSNRNTANGAEFRVEKKANSANEMSSNSKKQQQRPGTLLQRIRQRFTKSGDRRSAMAELDSAVPSAEHRLSVTMTVEVGTCQNGANGAQQHQQQKLQPQQHLGGAAPMAQQRREDYRLGGEWTRSGDALGDDDASQGRCSSFDYFSATASPIERQRATERRESGTTAEQTSPCHSGNKAADMEEELRFATAAEARAYLRRERGAEKGEEADEEQEGCDADDEITTATTSALCDSLLFQQRPHSAMASMPGQRESVYFTATVMVQSATTPDIARRKPPLQAQKDQQQLRGSGYRGLTRQKSRSQTELAENAGECGASAVGTAGSSHGSVPGSTTFSRRNLRFIIPQVSICDAEGVPKAANKNRNKNNNNDREEEEEDGNEKLGSELFNDEDIVNNNNNSQKNTANLGVTEAEDDGMLTEQDKQLRKVLSDMDRKQLTLAQRRQSNMDVVHQASGRRTSTTLIPLTSAQIHLIRSLWRQVYLSKGPTVIGSQISHRLFFKEPEMREMFRRCALPQQFANHDSFSKAHCKQISELIDQVVESLDDLEQVGPLLEQVGRCHAHISGGQLSSKLWNSVAETFIDCTLEWGDRRARSETVRKAWALIIAYMVERIKHGHLEERRQISAIRSTIASLERVALASTTVQQPYYEVQQPTTSSSTQLPVPVSSFCHPIRRVSAFATTGNFSDSAAAAARAEQHGRAAGGAAVTTVGTLPNYPMEIASSEACALATYANASPYANRRRHAQPPPPKASAEKREKKHHHHHHHHRRSSSSSSQQSPMIGSVGTVRRTDGGALAQRTKRTDAARKSTSNAALPLSLGSLRKKMSVSNASSMRKQNAKESADGSQRQWTDI
ncbi:hypothetical protein niasHT_004804 [Heterodera trifolii]|uniref:Globin domain-containing protein n=1 Tax=Heterodera trifolii TaxID=157864 RepID=A0ABD2M9L3_9BILA